MSNLSRVGTTGIKMLAAGMATWAAVYGGMVPTSVAAATVAATYRFNGGFTADETGAPALTPVDPLGASGFAPDSVLGQTRQVWNFNGTNNNAEQAGLTLNTTALIAPESYSLDMVCKFTMRDGAWRRLVDVENRQSDAGFYVDPSNNLDIFPVSGSTAAWTNNVYHHIVLTNDGAPLSVYLDGVSQFSATTPLLNLDFNLTENPNRLMGFFLDNVVAGGQGEWSAGSVGLARVWNGVLTAAEAQAIATNPFAVPEPSAGVLTGAALLAGTAVALGRRRLRSGHRSPA